MGVGRLESRLNQCWYGLGRGCHLLRLLLAPLSMVFWILSSLRRWGYALGLLRQTRLPVPVIVVGNITAGGAGKTPLTLALVGALQAAGYRPGIISRGYGGSHSKVQAVAPDSDPSQVGDEPVLMARRSACPVWVGRRRAQAGKGLLALNPEVNVLVADDGLQHLALARDLEIVVVDGLRGLGNGWLLPAGPLREPRGRLAGVDAIVVNGTPAAGQAWPRPAFAMDLAGEYLRNLADASHRLPAMALAGTPVQALAGIGNPQRFFDHLVGLGLTVERHVFPDHHAYSKADLPSGPLLMTEKDAVKVAPLIRAAGRNDAWYLEIDAVVDGGLKELVVSRLRKTHGLQTA